MPAMRAGRVSKRRVGRKRGAYEHASQAGRASRTSRAGRDTARVLTQLPVRKAQKRASQLSLPLTAADALTTLLHGDHLVHRCRLPNGLRVISVPRPQLHTASIALFVKVGSRYENARDNGLSHLLEHMLFRGCARYPTAHALSRAMEELGGTLLGATHSDSTLFEVSLPPQNIGRGIAILGELLSSPSFAELHVEKRIVREEILEYLDDSQCEVDPDNLSRGLMFGAHPLGMTITGSLANLERFGVSDLRAHMRKHYVASNIVLCVSGAIDERAVVQAALRHLGGLPGGIPRAALPATRTMSESRPNDKLRYVETQGLQTDVRLSFASFGSQDPRYVALELLCRVLDDGMSTRLHRRICEQLGLAYEVFASLEPYEECGVFDLGAAVEHSNVPVFIRHALELVNELKHNLVSKAELAKAKLRYRWQLEAILDDSQALCSHYGQRALFTQEGHLGALREQVELTTASELRAVAREVFRAERLHVVIVGMLERTARERVKRAMTMRGLPLAKARRTRRG